MKPTPKPRGFTLIEVMLALTILVGITLLAEQVVGQVSKAWLQGKSRSEANNVARALFNRVAIDLHNAVLPDDLPAFPEDELAFYTRRASVGGDRALSFIRYSLQRSSDQPGAIMRGDMAYSWEGGDSAPPWGEETMSTSRLEQRRLAEHVLGFAHRFLQENGTFSEKYIHPGSSDNGGNPTTGVVLTIAVADERAMRLLQDSGRTSSVMGDFESRTNAGEKSVAELWEEILSSDSLPVPVRTGIRIYERAIALPRTMSRPTSASTANN